MLDLLYNLPIPFSFMISEGHIINSILTIFFLYFLINRIAHFDCNPYKLIVLFYKIQILGLLTLTIKKKFSSS